MKQSLHDILLINNFKNVNVEFFKQLPILWNAFSWPIKLVSFLTRILLPQKLSNYLKWVRFSKEVMLLASAKKPDNN